MKANQLAVIGLPVESEPNAERTEIYPVVKRVSIQGWESLQSYRWRGGVPDIDMSGSEIERHSSPLEEATYGLRRR
jgi:hypothetical protein